MAAETTEGVETSRGVEGVDSLEDAVVRIGVADGDGEIGKRCAHRHPTLSYG